MSPDRNSTLKTSGLGVALAFLATEAVAEVQYVDNPDVTYSCGGGSMSASFNPITGATNASGNSIPVEAIGLTGCSGSNFFYFGCTAGTITSVGFLDTPVAENTLIDAFTGSWSDSTTPGTFASTADFTEYGPSETALVAYRFKTSADSETYLYGWAEFSKGDSGFYSVGLYSYAYEDSGSGILAGATSSIPEPGMTAAIFGFVALAFIGFRRLRTSRA